MSSNPALPKPASDASVENAASPTRKFSRKSGSGSIDHADPTRMYSRKSARTASFSSEVQSNPRRASFFIGDAEGNKLPVKIVGPDAEEITPDEIIVPPDGGYGYVIVFAAFMSNVIVDGIVFGFGSIKESILNASIQLGEPLEQATLAWVGSLLTGFYLLTGPFVSAVANKFGFRTVAVLGSIIAAFGFIMSWFLNRGGPNIGILILFYGIIGGIGFSCIYVPAVIAVGFYFEKKRALATGIAICGSGIGNFIFPPFITYLTAQYEWHGCILALGLIVLLCGVLGLLYKPLKPKNARKMSIMTPIDSPEGTPLLMRIKRARDIMNKWDSVISFTTSNRGDSFNDVQKAGGDDPKQRAEVLYNRARKSSTTSLKGVTPPVPIPLGGGGMNKKRLSVPSMLPGSAGENPVINQGTGILTTKPSLKSKSFVGLPDLHEIEEEHGSDDAGSRENSVVPDGLRQQAAQSIENDMNTEKGGEGENNNESANLLNTRNASVVTCRIGNSTLIMDEMTNSRIIRVASKVTLNKPLYRDDIFYSGSLLRIPDYANNNPMTSQEWTAVVASPMEDENVEEVADAPKKKKSLWNSSFEVVKKMLDFSLLRSPTFIVFCVSGMFSMVGLFVPFVYLMDQAFHVLHDDNPGLQKSELTMLISIIGAANTVGRILSGWIADRPWVNALILNNGAVTVMGLSTICVPVLNCYAHFMIFSGTFGISMACFASLRSILVVELLGLAKLTNAFGLLLLFQGIASMVATPLAGIIAATSKVEGDMSPDFSLAFYFAGTCLLFSAVMCYPLSRLNQWEKNRKEKKEAAAI